MNLVNTRWVPLCVAVGLSGCLGENRRPTDRPVATVRTPKALDPARPAVDDAAFRKMGFTTYWDSFIRDEELTSIHIEGGFEQEVGRPQLYAYTRSNRLYQIDLQSGMVNWVFDVGRPLSFADGHPIAEWVYKADKDTGLKRYDEVFFVAGDHLVALDKDNGSELWTVRLPFAASSPPQASGSHVFVGSWDDRIYAYRKDKQPGAPDWYWRTDGDLIARPCTDSPSLFVPSSDGKMYTFDAGTGERKWEFVSEQRLVQDPLLSRKLIYLPSDDFNLYVINALDGLLEYRFCAGAPITSHPEAIGKTVFFTAEGQGLFALARKARPRNASEGNTRKTQHELLWQRREASRILCKGASDFYVLEQALDEKGKPTGGTQVTKLGATDGKVRMSVDLPAADWILTDPYAPESGIREEAQLGGMIVLGWRNGWLLALKEIATLPGGAQVEAVEGPGSN